VLHDNLQYSNPGRAAKDGIYTLVKGTTQIPDITMEMQVDDARLLWLFDAKYRIDQDARRNEIPPNSTFDQMHRYRDALFQKKGERFSPVPILGAYILFPGTLAHNYYKASIEYTGVGAFSLLPRADSHINSALFQFLQEKLTALTTSTISLAASKTQENILYVEDPKRAPHIQSNRIVHQHNVLVVVSASMSNRSPAYQQKFSTGRADFYHLNCRTVIRDNSTHQNIVQKAQYLAVSHLLENRHHVQYIYPIRAAYIQPRNDIHKEQSGTEYTVEEDTLYWCFELDKSIRMSEVIEIPDVVGSQLYWMELSALLRENALPPALHIAREE